MKRRKFIKIIGMAGAAAIIPWRFDLQNGWQQGAAYAAVNSPGLALWQTPLRGVGGATGIPVMGSDGVRNWPATPTHAAVAATHYTIGIRQFTDTLHPGTGALGAPITGWSPTTLWGFGQGAAADFRHLGGLIIAQRGSPVQITFENWLTSDGTNGVNAVPLQHIIPVDVTILGANQAHNRTAVHLHGGLVPWISDGGPFDWWAPTGNGQGIHGSSFLNNQVLNPGATANQAEYYYPNDQSSRLVWYHDHAWGITRLSAYAGIATGYVIVDGYEATLEGMGVPAVGGPQYIPLVIQDKIFIGPNFIDPTWPAYCPQTVGSLWYPHTYDKKIFKLKGKKSPGSIPDPSAIPEMFGDTMLANGTVYPQVTVEARRYRLQILNACSSRFLNLQLYVADGTPDGITLNPVTLAPTNAGYNPAQDTAVNLRPNSGLLLGTEGGVLPRAVDIPLATPFNLLTLTGSLILGCAERADLIVDFTGYAGQSLILYNDAPGPFPGCAPIFDYLPNGTGAGPNTREIMRFNVVSATSSDPPLTITPAINLEAGNDPLLVPYGMTILNPNSPTFAGTYNFPAGATVHVLTLNEAFDQYGRLEQLLGNDTPTPAGFGKLYLDPASEVAANGATQVWRICNLSADTHPIHFHLVNVQVLGRRPIKAVNFKGIPQYLGPARLPDPDETGWKETVRMHPAEEITVVMKFQLPGVPFNVPSSPRAGVITPGTPGFDIGDTGLQLNLLTGQKAHEYVWHCHILEHEEHDMMRPLVVIE